jgi:hypothetical protein
MNQHLDELAFDFFKLFAQYESSLKERGFFIERRGQIIVDWDRFVNEEIGADFLEQLGDNRDSAVYILENPPKKQTTNETNKIIWAPVPNTERSVQILFGHISRVRNNLFHGAKFNGTWFDPERSNELLTQGLIVLRAFKHKAHIN